MPAFHYQAIDEKGKSSAGVMEGDSAKAVRLALREKSLIPVSVTLANEQKKSFKAKNKLSHQELTLITRQLATLIEARLPIEKALLGVSEQTEKKQNKSLLLGVRAKVLEGHSFAHALSQYPNTFPPLYTSTIEAGEQTGKLDLVLNQLADYTERQQTTRSKIQQALIYPSVMIVVSIAIISFLLTFVVPKIIGVFNSTGQTLPEATIILIAISDFLKHNGLYCLLFFIVVLFAFVRAIKTSEIFKLRWHQFLLKLPVLSYLIKSINTSRYAHTLAILTNAGVPILKGMQVASNLMTNLNLKEAVLKARANVKEGASLALSLKATQIFSPMAIHLIASGESSGRLEQMLKHAAKTQDQDVNRMIDTGLTLFEPFIILMMGSVVLFIVLATLLPIFSMDQLVH